MYGIDNNDEDILQQLLGYQPSATSQDFQAQGMPQITQGLLGDTGVNQAQQQNVQDLISGGKNAAASVAQQTAQPSGGGDDLQDRQQQLGSQFAAQEQQKQQQQRQMLMKLAMMFLGG